MLHKLARIIEINEDIWGNQFSTGQTALVIQSSLFTFADSVSTQKLQQLVIYLSLLYHLNDHIIIGNNG